MTVEEVIAHTGQQAQLVQAAFVVLVLRHGLGLALNLWASCLRLNLLSTEVIV